MFNEPFYFVFSLILSKTFYFYFYSKPYLTIPACIQGTAMGKEVDPGNPWNTGGKEFDASKSGVLSAIMENQPTTTRHQMWRQWSQAEKVREEERSKVPNPEMTGPTGSKQMDQKKGKREIFIDAIIFAQLLTK